ncbi:hypothetical protein FB446DRAFT_356988 [Lentinula raphanica]|nr:hypothetical protein FB446DRAFT_356988 [Lentinula raphanica]
MPSNAVRRSRNRSSSTALPKHEPPSNPNNRNQYSTPLMHHASAVHQPVTLTTSPLRPASAAQTSTTMSAASRYAHNLKVLRRRDPSIQRIIDQFSHVCVFHHNGKSWEKQGFEGPMFVYERADYPPYGFYVLNRMGMDDYIQRLWPEDILGVQGNYLWLRSWPEWSRKRICDIEASCGGKELNPFDERYKWDQQSRPIEGTEVYLTIGLWMFTTEVREPLMTVMLRLHDFIAKNLPYPEEYCYGPDNPPPPNPFPFMTNGAPKRTPSAASTASGVSASSSTHTGSANTTSSTRSRRHSPDMAFVSSSIHQMPQSGSMNSNPPDPDVETPKLRSKSLKRKGPRETFPIGSGDVTPMGHGSKQVSDLNTLFARLAQPSVSGRAVNAEPGSSSPSTMNDQPSMLENLMGQRDSIRPVLRSSFMSSSHLPRDDLSIPTKITLEGLFASVLKSPVDNESSNSPLNQNTEDGSIPDRQSRSHSESFHGSIAPETTRLPAGDDPDYRKSPATRTGLALLNDIFASASNSHPVSSGAIPSTSQSHGNFDTENQHALASVRPANSDTQDEPETIEIYSPRPQAPLSLASMFDAAALDDRSTPITGLGLEVNGVEHDHQTILTQSVLDTLLGTGGSMNRENDRSQVDIREEPVEMDGAEVEGVKRRRLLHIIGLRGSSQSPHGQTNANGNITPRGALDDSAESGPSSYAEPVLLNQSVPQTAVSFADTEIMFAEEDDDEPIVELDFSDTQALSDIRVFERRERVLREQLIERRVASRNASRSTTPAVVNFEQGTQPDEMNGAHSGAEVAIIDTHSDPEFTGPVLVDLTPSSQHLPFVKANVLPTSPAQMLQPRRRRQLDPPSKRRFVVDEEKGKIEERVKRNPLSPLFVETLLSTLSWTAQLVLMLMVSSLTCIRNNQIMLCRKSFLTHFHLSVISCLRT